VSETLRKWGRYSCQEGWAIYSQCERDLAKLEIYHLVNSLRCGDRPEECRDQVPAGRTLVEFAAAAWTPFHGRFFRDRAIGGHHREPGWAAFADRLSQMMARGATAPLEALTEEIYGELVAGPLERYLAHERQEWEEDRPFGIWRYDAHEDYVALHIHNVYMPESPFAHGAEVLAALQRIIEEIDRRGLKIARIGVDSWINWLPAFQAFFPAEFAGSLVPTTPDSKMGNGWWGQFISRTGHLSERRAEHLRRTRQFEYVRTHAECSFEAFREHVAEHV
jgi:hypothetical protein